MWQDWEMHKERYDDDDDEDEEDNGAVQFTISHQGASGAGKEEEEGLTSQSW